MRYAIGLCCALSLFPACGGEPPEPARGAAAPVVLAVPSCAAADEAPLPDGFGGVRCLHVGADVVASSRSSPDTAGLASPVVHVSPGATGDGTEARPLGAIADALVRLAGGGTLALHRGEHEVPSTLALPTGVTVVGVGPAEGTTLRVASARACFALAAGVRDVSSGLAQRVVGAERVHRQGLLEDGGIPAEGVEDPDRPLSVDDSLGERGDDLLVRAPRTGHRQRRDRIGVRGRW